jgi:colicin import membrane protein
MPRKLKTYQASLGFFDLAIAAPSMKAALEAWGSKTNHFHQGFAKESNDRRSLPPRWPSPVSF